VERKENKGNTIPRDMTNEIKNLPSGTVIYFDNVKIRVPGGDLREESAVFTIE
jgi:hypothetical protein